MNTPTTNGSLLKSTETDAGWFSNGNSKQEKRQNISIPASNHYYDTTHQKRGIALVFNHYEFDSNMPMRKGTEVDCARIKETLTDLDFDVQVHEDLTYSKLASVLKAASEIDHSNHDCFAVVVMSHGEEGLIHAKDHTYPVKVLWKNFVGNNCKSLIGKPRLFFIQACRGQELDEGVQFKDQFGYISTSTNERDQVDSKGSQTDIEYTIPKMADFLVMYSTFENHLSWRNPANGSWFIQSLCEEFKENGKTNDILALLTGVSRRVAYQYQSYNPENSKLNGNKQIPCICTMLTKFLYFTPKNSNVE